MKAGSNRRVALLAAFAGFVIGVGVCVRFDLFARSEAGLFGQSEGSGPPSQAPAVAIPDFADLAKHVSPAVVNISTTQEVKNPHGFNGPQGPGQTDENNGDVRGGRSRPGASARASSSTRRASSSRTTTSWRTPTRSS